MSTEHAPESTLADVSTDAAAETFRYRVKCCEGVLYEGIDKVWADKLFAHMHGRSGHRVVMARTPLYWNDYRGDGVLDG